MAFIKNFGMNARPYIIFDTISGELRMEFKANGVITTSNWNYCPECGKSIETGEQCN